LQVEKNSPPATVDGAGKGLQICISKLLATRKTR
jgi:hypothetical protein